MKVVYNKTILDEIQLAVRAASLVAGEIEHVEISAEEARRLIRELNLSSFYSYGLNLVDFEMWLNERDTVYPERSSVYVYLRPQPQLTVFGARMVVA